MKLGIFGGSFNPPHVGHLIVIESVRDILQFDKVLFIPSAQTPNKQDSLLAPPAVRLEMAHIAVKGSRYFEASDIELQRRGISYTIDTVNELASRYTRFEISLIIGADNLAEFETWKSPDEILAKTELIVMNRPGFDPRSVKNKYSRSAKFVNVPQIGISGTDIRRRIKLGHSIHYLVPQSVENYILQQGLYKK
jgi:nicotinate-nucleotide adenylyltransferase